MESKMWSNKRPFMTMIYNAIIGWARHYDYSIPSITWLENYEIKFLMAERYESSNGYALGTCYSTAKKIKIAGLQEHSALVTTIVHELGHAVQFFNFGTNWTMMYNVENNNIGYKDNKYEKEANHLENHFMSLVSKDTELASKAADFTFEFEPDPEPEPKPLPKPTSKPIFNTRPDWFYMKDWKDSYGKKFRRDWWNKY